MRPPTFLRTGLTALALGACLAATAAPLPDMPDTLIEKSRLVRESRDRVWDPASGQLGNLRQVRIVAEGCTVRVISGPDNRLIGPRDMVDVGEDNYIPGDKTVPRDVVLRMRGGAKQQQQQQARGTPCFTLQVATADYFLLSGDRATYLFDRVEQPAMRVFFNPSSQLRVWFQDVKMGLLSVESNAGALAGGTGQVQWLKLSSAQSSTSMLFHEVHARHIGVTSLAPRARYSIRIGPDTKAGYYQPARAPGNLAELYPIWIDGPLDALNIPASRVHPMALTPEIRREALALRNEVLGRAGPSPALPSSPGPAALVPSPPVATAPRQLVADGFRPYLPPGVELASVNLHKAGGAMEGTAPDVATVRTLVQSLGRSPDVVYTQLAFTRPQGAQVAFRVLFDLACQAPGEPSICLSGSNSGNGSAYTEEQIRGELLPLLGPQVDLTRLQLREGGVVLLEGRASDADARAALARVREQAPWLRGSSSGIGNGSFSARMVLVCQAPPPRQGGICKAPLSAKR
ncbi:hypothetical protein HNP48_001436 [Acidovorax soli]|uniref:SPOR domain-containing protein n=1 Tax=Acidovorax soli TaxID=592050 RepID=A0A7X0PC06_9BURK|nr:hypothetical protein [Acidovorax soli]MBB6558772.1 hypothetical protein [Acidovorax soli]